MSGLLHGVLGVLGLGSAYDPLADARGKLSNKISEFNNMTADMSLLAASSTNETLKNLSNDIIGNADKARIQLQQTTNLIWDSLEDTNLFIIFLYILVFVIVFYILYK